MVPKTYNLRSNADGLDFEIKGEKSRSDSEILSWYDATTESTKAYVYLAERESFPRNDYSPEVTGEYDKIIHLPIMKRLKVIYVFDGNTGNKYARLDVKKDLHYTPIDLDLDMTKTFGIPKSL